MDQWRARLRLGSPTSSDDPDIHLLTPSDVRDLRLPWLSRFNSSSLSRHLAAYPNMALWVRRTGEYIISEPWRNREEIANICEATARRGKAQLVHSLLNVLQSGGCRLVLLNSEAWREQGKPYMDLGFEKIETIVFFEKVLRVGNRVKEEGVGNTPSPYSLFPTLRFSLAGLSDLDLLLEIDHDSFPWLWWNSRAEFEIYLQMPGVYACIAYYEGEPVGYASFTIYQGWGHLDRLAVVNKHQGRKFGAAQLAHALQLMTEKGASSVALSTQVTNVRSHRLYKDFGFHQTSETMSFYGKRLKIED
jgi:GNAT superfamily N-acetyltransferase